MMFKNYYLGASDSFTNLLTQRACTEDFPKCLCSFLVPVRERWTPGQPYIHCQERGCSRLLGTSVEQYFVGTEVQKSRMGRREQFQPPLWLTWHSITHTQHILACPMFRRMVWKLHLLCYSYRAQISTRREKFQLLVLPYSSSKLIVPVQQVSEK